MKNVVVFEDDALELDSLVKKINFLKHKNSNLSQLNLITFSKSQDVFLFIEERPAVSLFILDIYEGEAKAGLELLGDIKVKYDETSHVVMHTNSKGNKDIIKAVKLGADHFIVKGCDKEELEIMIECYLTDDQNRDNILPYHGIEVAGKTLRKIKSNMPALMISSVKTVFIQGPTGSGKEMVAEIIKGYHGNKASFVTVNCAQFSEETAVAELFGYVKGAFTGAEKDKIGLIESANDGWIFLDEIAELSLRCQALLLRAIDNQVIIPMGSNKEQDINVRFIAATKENIPRLVRKKEFRDDLWNRLNQNIIELPALTHRKTEIKDIARHIARDLPNGPFNIPKATMILLEELDWTVGNVRELKNCIINMTVKAKGNRSLLPSYIELSQSNNHLLSDTEVTAGIVSFDFSEHLSFNMWTLKLFSALLDYIYQKNGHSISVNKVSKMIGISRGTIVNYKRSIELNKGKK